jgi:hypothetical protein
MKFDKEVGFKLIPMYLNFTLREPWRTEPLCKEEAVCTFWKILLTPLCSDQSNENIYKQKQTPGVSQVQSILSMGKSHWTKKKDVFFL